MEGVSDDHRAIRLSPLSAPVKLFSFDPFGMLEVVSAFPAPRIASNQTVPS